jgi:hypothetical protein
VEVPDRLLGEDAEGDEQGEADVEASAVRVGTAVAFRGW